MKKLTFFTTRGICIFVAFQEQKKQIVEIEDGREMHFYFADVLPFPLQKLFDGHAGIPGKGMAFPVRHSRCGCEFPALSCDRAGLDPISVCVNRADNDHVCNRDDR